MCTSDFIIYYYIFIISRNKKIIFSLAYDNKGYISSSNGLSKLLSHSNMPWYNGWNINFLPYLHGWIVIVNFEFNFSFEEIIVF